VAVVAPSGEMDQDGPTVVASHHGDANLEQKLVVVAVAPSCTMGHHGPTAMASPQEPFRCGSEESISKEQCHGHHCSHELHNLVLWSRVEDPLWPNMACAIPWFRKNAYYLALWPTV
jgi:hypothetical protein